MSNEEIKIAILEQRLVDFITVVDKLENAINKINDVNSNILKMVAVHNEKIEQFYKYNDGVQKLIYEVSERNDDSIKICMKKIDDIERYIDQMPDLDSMLVDIEDVSKIKWMTIGCGVVLTVLATSLSTLASGWWTPAGLKEARSEKTSIVDNVARTAVSEYNKSK